ncbi:hypothetical protein FPOA_03887 [Fusarium poae]|uniref:HNH nuclease domain-containing protein n=1 Tax=Fusarium poae TaxID=36050 RepID=A0A1B8AS32_FUSPO|nr:hypothetical protein FPOA_03887 [Fusarium poae]
MLSTNSVFHPDSSRPFRSESERVEALVRFYQVIAMYQKNDDIKLGGFDRARLVQLTYEHCCSQRSQDRFLVTAYHQMGLEYFPDDTELSFDFKDSLYRFADHLMNFYFQPFRLWALFKRQPTAKSSSACLIRDRHKCVVSRKFDVDEAMERYERHGPEGAVDDDGARLFGTGYNQDRLVVTHILPPVDRIYTGNNAVLELLDDGVTDTIEGVSNTLTLTARNEFSFSNFGMFFERVGKEENTYVIKTFLPRALNQPLTRTLFVPQDTSIDMPSARLLNVHRAMAQILHLSGAGAYIDEKLDISSSYEVPKSLA